MHKYLLILAGCLGLGVMTSVAQDTKPPVRFAMVGLVHDHAMGFLPRLEGQNDLQLVGIVETNQSLIDRYSKRFNLPPDIFFSSLDELFAKTNAQAVAAFTSTFDHERVVEACAAHGVDVMMEKPLATNRKQARAIQAAAEKSGIQVIVNYETSWYPGNHEAYKLVHDQHLIGDIRRMVFHHGHRGPQEIGCSTNFLAWLTDPVLNGGGAINDFGCYGADLATWFLDGEKPLAVSAVALHIKPDIYPKVEDDATIVLVYPKAEVVLQPSWNWPMDRKDMEIYGQTGQVLVPQAERVLVRTQNAPKEKEIRPAALTGAEADPVAYLAAVVRKEVKPEGLASLGVNVTVVEILEAAQKSARTGREVKL
ncbi:MAG TPA: Gfo/Idh/MocA family oxidoreductase [Candidatus Acidoferrales bacterium]|nr:Gfo/Idh/MocA family oxidoreductase [Candidatus Acidoferrales bacterium]